LAEKALCFFVQKVVTERVTHCVFFCQFFYFFWSTSRPRSANTAIWTPSFFGVFSCFSGSETMIFSGVCVFSENSSLTVFRIYSPRSILTPKFRKNRGRCARTHSVFFF
jgi:hypothetical protein